MLFFIILNTLSRFWFIYVSIHLMLFFICILLSVFLFRGRVSIHLMLFFITIRAIFFWIIILFQYISCYSLSFESQIGSREDFSFNTSHVILYRWKVQERLEKNCVSIHLMLFFIDFSRDFSSIFPSFQYISCYSLSEETTKLVVKISVFQYISCYSLSGCCRQDFYPFINVSIHLMLFFIITIFVSLIRYALFQYISCYSLSSVRHTGRFLLNMVSIHLMLFFIKTQKEHVDYQRSFNTSHVILYRKRTAFKCGI